jgi:hypothetical protein
VLPQLTDPQSQLIVARRYAEELREDWRAANGRNGGPCAPGFMSATRDYASRLLAELAKRSLWVRPRPPQRRTSSPAGGADSRC